MAFVNGSIRRYSRNFTQLLSAKKSITALTNYNQIWIIGSGTTMKTALTQPWETGPRVRRIMDVWRHDQTPGVHLSSAANLSKEWGPPLRKAATKRKCELWHQRNPSITDLYQAVEQRGVAVVVFSVACPLVFGLPDAVFLLRCLGFLLPAMPLIPFKIASFFNHSGGALKRVLPG